MVGNRFLSVLVIVGSVFATMGNAEAALYDIGVPGTIYEVLDGNQQRIGTTVDHWLLSAVGGITELSIDVLSWEAGETNAAGEYLFVNKVGQGSPEPAFFDTWIYLFGANPDGTPGSLIATNDDNPNLNYNDDIYGAGWRDGSISSTDSYMRVSIPEGNYVLALGAYELSEAAARSGLNQSGSGGYWYPLTIDDPDGDGYGPLHSGFSRGDYLVTLTTTCGNVDVIPEPASLGIWGVLGIVGIAACCLRRRRRRWRLND